MAFMFLMLLPMFVAAAVVAFLLTVTCVVYLGSGASDPEPTAE